MGLFSKSSLGKKQIILYDWFSLCYNTSKRGVFMKKQMMPNGVTAYINNRVKNR